jgi:hypothetical protein
LRAKRAKGFLLKLNAESEPLNRRKVAVKRVFLCGYFLERGKALRGVAIDHRNLTLVGMRQFAAEEALCSIIPPGALELQRA